MMNFVKKIILPFLKYPLTLSNAYKFSLSHAWRCGFFTLRNNYKHTKTWRYIGEISREELVWLKDEIYGKTFIGYAIGILQFFDRP